MWLSLTFVSNLSSCGDSIMGLFMRALHFYSIGYISHPSKYISSLIVVFCGSNYMVEISLPKGGRCSFYLIEPLFLDI